MLKKLLFCATLILGSTAMFAQTIVSTTPENRNVVLEEFTGIYCGFCPQGHAIAEEIKDNNPDDVFLVNIHSGGFANPSGADPDFRTPFGQAIDDQSGLTGYPAGTVNRENFSGLEQGAAGSTAMSRGNWSNAADMAILESSYLNVAVEADLNVQTSEMTIHVETYYTADSPVSTNKLNVYILQNNTLGPQSGGNMGNNYNHQHRLIDMPTGQWGADITNTTTGSFDDRTIVYNVPADHNGIPVEFGNLEIVVSIAEGEQYIVSGSGAEVTLSGFTAANDSSILNLSDVPVSCLAEGTANPIITLFNQGSSPVTSLDIAYDINGGTESTFTYTGSIMPFTSAAVELAEITYTPQANNTLEVRLTDDEDNSNNTISTSFEDANQGAGNITVAITTDQYANETAWTIKNSAGTTVANGNLTAANNNSTVEFEVELEDADCFTFELTDSFGDGIFGDGGATLTDINGVELLTIAGASFQSIARTQFGADGVLGTAEETFETLSIYPNPATTFVNIANAENATIEIYDVRGRKIRNIDKASKNEKVDTNRMPTGAYFVKITKDGFTTTEKLLIK